MAFENLRGRIAVAGVGYTPQGKVEGRTAVSFHCEAIRNALEDAGIEKTDVDALLLYRHFDPVGGDQDVTLCHSAQVAIGRQLVRGLAAAQLLDPAALAAAPVVAVGYDHIFCQP